MTSPISGSISHVPTFPVSTPGVSSSTMFPASPANSGAFASFMSAAASGVNSVSKLQNQATAATEQLALGETDDVVGVMAQVEKGELAFKTLLAVRSKLMTAFDEIRNMPI